MDALFAMNRGGFQQLVAHISLYHEDASPGYVSFSKDVLNAAGLNAEKYKIWDVKGMGQILGKSLPLDIHGDYVLFDELGLHSPTATHGMLRYGFLSAAVRAKNGGRQRYDYLTMNGSILGGTIAGLAFLTIGRKKSQFLKKHPATSICLSVGVCMLGMGMVRAGFKVFNIGMLMAERSHESALKMLPCPDCLTDVYLSSEEQVKDMELASIPQSAPGMPPPPPEYIAQWKKGMETQTMLIKRDMLRMKVQLRKAEEGDRCAVHSNLRTNPWEYLHPEGQPVFPRDRELAAARAGGEGAIDTTLSEEDKNELKKMKLEFR